MFGTCSEYDYTTSKGYPDTIRVIFENAEEDVCVNWLVPADVATHHIMDDFELASIQ